MGRVRSQIRLEVVLEREGRARFGWRVRRGPVEGVGAGMRGSCVGLRVGCWVAGLEVLKVRWWDMGGKKRDGDCVLRRMSWRRGDGRETRDLEAREDLRGCKLAMAEMSKNVMAMMSSLV